jgi:long-chain acyl-CoA synthetase
MQAGAQVAFARSVQALAEDLQTIRPTILISVPRIYERFHERIHEQLREKSRVARWLFRQTMNSGWRRFQKLRSPLWPVFNKLVAHKILQRLGGRLRLAICGGAPMPLPVGRTFLSLGMNLVQGYGLTETSPIVCGVREKDNHLGSVGIPLNGVEIRIGPQQELWTRSPSVMLGYWNNPQATRDIIDDEGWLHSGDQASIEHGRITITGRLKDIIVLSTGKKVAPLEMEIAVTAHPLIEQVLIAGEGKAFLVALVILNGEQWQPLCAEHGMDARAPASLHDAHLQAAVLRQINGQLSDFPKHARIRRLWLGLDPWTVENGMVTPTLKLRRKLVLEHYAGIVESLYTGRT